MPARRFAIALSVSDAVRVLGQRAADDADLADTLRYLAGNDDGPDTPFDRKPNILGAPKPSRLRQQGAK